MHVLGTERSEGSEDARVLYAFSVSLVVYLAYVDSSDLGCTPRHPKCTLMTTS